jgi:hypothetical protein
MEEMSKKSFVEKYPEGDVTYKATDYTILERFSSM